MPLLHKPEAYLPENVISIEQTLEMARVEHRGSPDLALAMRLITNTGVAKRHLIQPVELALLHPGFEYRNTLFEIEAKRATPALIEAALTNAELGREDIDAIIFVSCTGFMMPSMTAWLINHMKFPYTTVQIPISQLGCAAGGAAINRAADYVNAHPGSNVIIVSCELCSLCYQPTDSDIGSLLSDGLFGDAMSAAVVSSGRDVTDAAGLNINRVGSYIIPDTEDWISYKVRETGFHFRLDKRVPGTMEPLAPVIRDLAAESGWDASALDFYVIHAGGPRILDDLAKYLGVGEWNFRYSRETLTECGNIASSVVLEACRRAWEDGAIEDGQKGIIAGFGPGITAEMSLLTASGVFK